MKKTLLFLTISIFTITSFAQKAKKPTIMVVPSDVWCNQNNFTQTFNNQGSEVLVPDYKKALQNDPTLLQVISQLNGMMAEKGFPLKNLESELKSLEAESAEDAMRSSSKTGGELQTSPIDQLKMVAKADIWMQISYNVNGYGMQSIQFNLQGLDAYTNKQVATAVGNGEPSTGSVPELMQEAVNAHLDNFCSSLMDHFDDMFANGREVIMRIKVWDDWGEDLETEDYGDDELGILIEDWVSDNTVNGVYNLTTATENMMLFEQCRIPLFYIRKEKERAYDVRRFGSDLMKYLSKELEIESKREADGLGKVTLFIGHK
jgi:hypothetical protein